MVGAGLGMQRLIFVDGVSAGIRTGAPWAFTLSDLSIGDHTLKATATDSDGATNATAPKRIRII